MNFGLTMHGILFCHLSDVFTLFYMFDVDDSVCMCVYVYVCAKAIQCSDFLAGDFTKKKNIIFKRSDV